MVSEKDFFHQAAPLICGSLEIDKALHRCFQYIRNFIPADRATLLIFDRGLGALRLIARVDEHGGEVSDMIVPLSPEA